MCVCVCVCVNNDKIIKLSDKLQSSIFIERATCTVKMHEAIFTVGLMLRSLTIVFHREIYSLHFLV